MRDWQNHEPAKFILLKNFFHVTGRAKAENKRKKQSFGGCRLVPRGRTKTEHGKKATREN
jgi:hypothetical protein